MPRNPSVMSMTTTTTRRLQITTTFLACLFLAAGALPLLAETSDIGRELNQIEDQHTKAVAAALEPITRRYQVALEQLLKRATQTNDLDTALKIKERIA